MMIGAVIYLQSLKPQYSGNLVFEGLHKAVDVYFDPRAVAHISARNANEAILQGAILGRKI
ncbi:MAG: hypothetical protein KJP23_15770 [Deltaproteobacteria bacterium]|nr:hypothetical protein [Deltaproteobacteria bacterium]